MLVRSRRWRPTLRDLRDAAVSLITTAGGLAVGIALFEGLAAETVPALLAVAAVIGAADWLVRPVLRALAGVLGAAAALLGAVAAQAVVLWAALLLVPGVRVGGWRVALAVLVVAAVAMVVGRWLVGVNDSAYLLGDVLSRARRVSGRRRRDALAGVRRAEPQPDGPPGVLVVQLDGLSAPVLHHAVQAGLLPTIARWLRSGSHRLQPWWAQVPSTTPASQAGLLHGAADAVPAFRWWDKRAGRLVVSNRPRDAAAVEAGLTDGCGLLAGGGVSVSNMFTGDAATSLLVMSRAGFGPGRSYVRFLSRPFVLVRVVLLTFGEMVKELYQGHQQRLRGVWPRVRRTGSYVLLRGITNVLMRDLNVGLVAEHLLQGAPVVYVDLVDYDEVAHHAGPARPESLRSLEGLDRVLGLLEQLVAVAPRRYELLVVSDHGQSQGPTFVQLTGQELRELVAELTRSAPGPAASTEVSGTTSPEDWGPLNALLSDLVSTAGRDREVVLGPHRRLDETEGDRPRVLRRREPVAAAPPATSPPDAQLPPEVVVAASGNYACLWFARRPGRVPLEDVSVSWPRLVPGLASSPGIGTVVVGTRDRGPVAVGPAGLVVLETGEVEGVDPLAAYGPRARADLLRAHGLESAGDLLLVSSVDPATGEVHSFEHHVGSHGGLGGDQNAAVLVHPAGWTVDADLLDTSVPGESVVVGADRVHEQLLRWWRRLGLRDDVEPVGGVRADPPPAAPLPRQPVQAG